LWFASRVARLTSIEHDPTWHARVASQLAEGRVGNVDYRLARLEEMTVDGVPRYVSLGAELGVESVDFALVDGMYRDQSAQVAMARLRGGGLLIIDNAEQFLPYPSHSPSALQRTKAERSPLWRQVERQLATWQCVWTSNGAFDTALFTKPMAGPATPT
jgi:predicted O-methyltransferase YrrM